MKMIIANSPKLDKNRYPAGLHFKWDTKKQSFLELPRELFFLVGGNYKDCEGQGYYSLNLQELARQLLKHKLYLFIYSQKLQRWELQSPPEDHPIT